MTSGGSGGSKGVPPIVHVNDTHTETLMMLLGPEQSPKLGLGRYSHFCSIIAMQLLQVRAAGAGGLFALVINIHQIKGTDKVNDSMSEFVQIDTFQRCAQMVCGFVF